MTIASEITRINNNIAAAYTALSGKGATMPATQNSANLATTVATVSSGGGDTIMAINYTGAAIAQGDKVWLNKKANVSASSVSVTGGTSVSDTVFPMDVTGNSVFYKRGAYYYKYDITSTDTTEIVTNPEYDAGFYAVYYDNYNNMFVKTVAVNASGVSDTGMICNQDNYAIEYKTTSSSACNLYKIDKEDNFNITKTWAVSSITGIESYKRSYAIIGNKFYSKANSYNGKIGTIDDNSSTITMNYRTDGFLSYDIINSTLDNKVAFAVKRFVDGSNYKGWQEVKLINVNNDYTLGSEFVSSNSDLNNLLAQTPIYFTFNRVTGILCISQYGNRDTFGVFKYENNDFTTIALTFSTSQTLQGYYVMYSSADLSKIQFGSVLFNLAQTADGTYKAIPYTYSMGSQTLTGIANEAAANGASFEATTIIPE